MFALLFVFGLLLAFVRTRWIYFLSLIVLVPVMNEAGDRALHGADGPAWFAGVSIIMATYMTLALIHMSKIIYIFVCEGLYLTKYRERPDTEHTRHLAKVEKKIFLTFLKIVLCYSLLVSIGVWASAKKIAKGNPYGIVTSKVYAPCAWRKESCTITFPSSFLDTFGLLMMGNENQNHAVLVVKNPQGQFDRYHWSYRANSFLPGSYISWSTIDLKKYFGEQSNEPIPEKSTIPKTK